MPRVPQCKQRSAPSGRFGGALAAVLMAAGASGQIVVPEWALPAFYGDEHPDYVVVTLGGATVDGDVARFQERTGLARTGFVGIAEMSLFRELGEDEDQVLKIDLRAMGGLNELDLDLSYEKLDAWRFDLAVRQHRSYFDPTAGFGTTDLDAQSPLELDAGIIQFEAEKSFEDLPTFRLRYTRRYRDGERASTIWGQRGARRTGAALRVVDETSDRVDLEVEGRTENRRWRVSGHYEETSSESTRRVVNDSGVNPPEPIEQTELIETERASANAYIVQKVFDDLTISLGGMVTELDANVSGSRLVSNGSAFVNLTGDSELYQYAVNGNVAYRWNPFVDSVVGVSVRGEELQAESRKNRGTGPDAVTTVDERDFVDVAFETRLRGSKRANFYFLVKRTEGDGVLDEEGDRISRLTDSEESATRYAAGFRLYPAPRVSLSGEIYQRRRTSDFVHQRRDAFPAFYPGYITALEEKTEAANLRLTVRPIDKLHLVSRADVRHRQISPSYGSGSAPTASDVDHLTLSQNLSFTPKPGIVIQAMASWTENLHRTPLSAAGGELARILPESTNDHWSLQLGLYAALTEEMDLQMDYTFFRTSNYFDNSDVALPLGAAEEEHQLNLILSRQFTERLRGLIRYGYFHGRDLRSIALQGFNAQVVYTSFHYRF